jgi:hypothetical protein
MGSFGMPTARRWRAVAGLNAQIIDMAKQQTIFLYYLMNLNLVSAGTVLVSFEQRDTQTSQPCWARQCRKMDEALVGEGHRGTFDCGISGGGKFDR